MKIKLSFVLLKAGISGPYQISVPVLIGRKNQFHGPGQNHGPDRSNYGPAVRESLLKGLKTFPDISKSPDIEDFMLVNNEITSLPRLANQERG